MDETSLLLGEELNVEHISLLCTGCHVEISDKGWSRVDRAVSTLTELNQTEVPVYGVSTGFGQLQNKWITPDQQKALQLNLIRSHAAGSGAPVPVEITRTAMILLANSLAKGHSGIRKTTLELLIQLINYDLIPVTYSLGSLGASGDLAPLAHIALVLVGEGEIWNQGQIQPASAILDKYNLQSVELAAKEGLALINGTHFMTAYALHILSRGRNLIIHSLISSALSLEALMGTDKPFSPLIASLRPHWGHLIVSKSLRYLLEGSHILASHRDPNVDHRVQDPYVLRCIPQVMGAVWDAFAYLEQAVLVEMNSITDNPLIFPSSRTIISGGNFHGEPLALPLETVSMAMIEIGNITEGRISRLVNPSDSHVADLKPFLAISPGVESGYMIAHYTVAAILNRLRVLAHPAVTDNIPVSGGQEDHVSMGMNSATKALEILELAEEIVASELIIATRALNLSDRKRSSPQLEDILAKINTAIPMVRKDHIVRHPIQNALLLLRSVELISNHQFGNLIPVSFQRHIHSN